MPRRKKKPAMMQVRLVKSPIGRLRSHKACVAGLGLRRVGQAVEVEDTPATRGMVERVAYMVNIEDSNS